MDPVGIKLEPDDLVASDFPLPHVFASTRTVLEGETVEMDGETVEGDPDGADYLIGDWFGPMPSRPLHATRCAAVVKSTGKRCRRWSVIGFERCPNHSGYGKLANLAEYRERVLERARLDLLKSAPYAIERLVEIARDREINPAVSMKASTEILDRIGVKSGTDLNVTVKTDGPSAADTIRARLERLAELEAGSPDPAAESEIIDAVEVPDELA